MAGVGEITAASAFLQAAMGTENWLQHFMRLVLNHGMLQGLAFFMEPYHWINCMVLSVVGFSYADVLDSVEDADVRKGCNCIFLFLCSYLGAHFDTHESTSKQPGR
ncbi:hypothetical protein C1H46_009133 [Malus baccata]|uniref:Uncharacterized protein n=1 Tax=Malus baccata TaxID=106549 RepID=A0A540N2J5_MALBA|nr:hypothetical protein C1H46_009133 [Malus baccata]